MPLAILAIIAAALLFPLVSTLTGAFTGWVVGMFFHDTIMTFLIAVGVDVNQLSTWEVGAALGFIGGFFKTVRYRNA